MEAVRIQYGARSLDFTPRPTVTYIPAIDSRRASARKAGDWFETACDHLFPLFAVIVGGTIMVSAAAGSSLNLTSIVKGLFLIPWIVAIGYTLYKETIEDFNDGPMDSTDPHNLSHYLSFLHR